MKKLSKQKGDDARGVSEVRSEQQAHGGCGVVIMQLAPSGP